MPLYEYRCQDCGSLSELLQRFDDPPAEKCPECGGKLRKLVSAPAFQFKGTGWYVTDYARGGQATGGKAGKEEQADGAGSASSAAPSAAEPAADKGSGSTKGEGAAKTGKDAKPASVPTSGG